MATEPNRILSPAEQSAKKLEQEGLLADSVLRKQREAAAGFNEFKPQVPSPADDGSIPKEGVSPKTLEAIKNLPEGAVAPEVLAPAKVTDAEMKLRLQRYIENPLADPDAAVKFLMGETK